MNSLSWSTALVASVLAFACVAGSVPAAALSRVDGQFWTYDLSMNVLGLNATGTVSYDLSGRDKIIVGGSTHDADIYTIRGNLSASGYLYGVPYSVTAMLEETRYNPSGHVSVLEEDTEQWTNASVQAATPLLLARIDEQSISTWTPAYMSGFDPDTTGRGDSWDEQVTLTTKVIRNGTELLNSSGPINYHFVIGQLTESVTVGAGTFEALRITATSGQGGQVIYWWSSKAQAFVLEKHFGPMNSAPTKILSLSSYNLQAGSGLLIPIIVGAAIVAVAVVILGFLLNARKPKGPIDQSQFDEGLVGSPRLKPPKHEPGEESAEQPRL